MVDFSFRYLSHNFFSSTICILKNQEKDENEKQKVNILTNRILRYQSMIKVLVLLSVRHGEYVAIFRTRVEHISAFHDS